MICFLNGSFFFKYEYNHNKQKLVKKLPNFSMFIFIWLGLSQQNGSQPEHRYVFLIDEITQ